MIWYDIYGPRPRRCRRIRGRERGAEGAKGQDDHVRGCSARPTPGVRTQGTKSPGQRGALELLVLGISYRAKSHCATRVLLSGAIHAPTRLRILLLCVVNPDRAPFPPLPLLPLGGTRRPFFASYSLLRRFATNNVTDSCIESLDVHDISFVVLLAIDRYNRVWCGEVLYTMLAQSYNGLQDGPNSSIV